MLPRQSILARVEALEAAGKRFARYESVELRLRDELVEAALQEARVRKLGYFLSDDGRSYELVPVADGYYLEAFQKRTRSAAEALLRAAADVPSDR